MSAADFYQLEIEGAGALFAVDLVRGREQIHAPWRYEVSCRVVDADGLGAHEDLAALVGAKTTLSFPAGSERRVLEGIVDELETLEELTVRVAIVHPTATLEDAVDYVVFVDKDTIAIAKQVLDEHGLTLDAKVSRSLTPRPQCVQHFESDLAFVSRILAEEGISWFLPVDRPNDVVACDTMTTFPDAPFAGPIEHRDDAMGAADEAIFEPEISRAITTTKVTLRDYNFIKPLVDLTAESGTTGLDRYEFPGGYDEKALGTDLAKLRLEEALVEGHLLRARTSSGRLLPGHVVEITSDRADVEGKWLVLEVEHEGHDRHGVGNEDRRLECRFRAVPVGGAYRPPRRAKPAVTGIQTATVTGAGGAELHTEEHARIRSLLRWDRRNAKDDKASTWIRVVMPATSGSVFLPRTSWEGLVGFVDSYDAPIEIARMYNSTSTPPMALPGKKTSSSFGSQTMGSSGGNVMTMDDTAGKENLSFTASKNWNEKTENDKVTNVTADDTTTIGANNKVIVGEVARVEIKGAQTYSVGATRKVAVDANFTIQSGPETVMIGGLRGFKVGGDYVTNCATLTRLVGASKIETAIEHQSRHVTGAATTLVGGTWKVAAALGDSIRVGGASTLLVSGAKKVTSSKMYFQNVRGILSETLASRKIKAGGDREEGFNAAARYTVAAGGSMKGAEVTFTATSKITINAGGVTLEITSSKVTISGKFKGSGDSADQGSKEEVG